MSGQLNFGGWDGATLSSCGRYRYDLLRRWDDRPPWVLFVMLNPSTADATSDDPTIRRCQGYARAWGYGALRVANLFALRSTDPAGLRCAADPVGPKNDATIQRLSHAAPLTVAAWGAHPFALDRARDVARRLLLAPHCLDRTRDGHPRHPLYLRRDLLPVPWEGYR